MTTNYFYVSLFHSLIVLSFSRAAEAIMLSVGWHVVQSTTSENDTCTQLISKLLKNSRKLLQNINISQRKNIYR